MQTPAEPFDAAAYLHDQESRLQYLRLSFESGDIADITEGIGTVARATGMVQVAGDAGLARPALYRALSKEGNPQLGTVISVLKALGLRLAVEAIPPDPELQ